MSRIENLGDYNKARLALQEVSGNLDTLYKQVGDTAVAKAAPSLLLRGGIVGAGICGVVILVGNQTIRFLKARKQLIENEPALKTEFAQTMEPVVSEMVEEDVQ